MVNLRHFTLPYISSLPRCGGGGGVVIDPFFSSVNGSGEMFNPPHMVFLVIIQYTVYTLLMLMLLERGAGFSNVNGCHIGGFSV